MTIQITNRQSNVLAFIRARIERDGQSPTLEEIGEALGIGNVVVFPQSSVFSAFGGGLLPIAHTYHAAVADVSDHAGLSRTMAGLTDRAWRDLRAERPDAELFFITGADAVEQILDWKNIDELWSLAHFVAVSRPGHTLTVSNLPQQVVSLLEVPALAISSTDCRARVGRGFPVWYLVPDGVVQYISKYHLYRSLT